MDIIGSLIVPLLFPLFYMIEGINSFFQNQFLIDLLSYLCTIYLLLLLITIVFLILKIINIKAKSDKIKKFNKKLLIFVYCFLFIFSLNYIVWYVRPSPIQTNSELDS